MRWIFLFVCLCLSANAATYYVDFNSGADSNAGTSIAPFKHSPGDPNATGNALATVLGNGDTVNFKGGVAYVGGVNGVRLASGVTYQSYDSGKGIITTSNAVDSAGFEDNGQKRNNLTIQNLIFADIGGYADNDPIWATTNPVTAVPEGTGIDLEGDGTNIVIRACDFVEVGQWQRIIPMSGVNSVSGKGIALENNKTVTISNCTFLKMRVPISIKSTAASGPIQDINVISNQINGWIVWGLDISPRSAGAILKNINIEANTLRNMSQYDAGNWQGYGDKPHRDDIFLRTAGMVSYWTNIVIRRNIFYDDDPQNSQGGTASIFVSQGPSATIYNNIFLNDPQANATIQVSFSRPSGMYQDVFIANNTIIGSAPCLKALSVHDRVRLYNNAVFRTVNGKNYYSTQVDPSQVIVLDVDYNRHWTSYSNTNTWNMGFTDYYKTIAQWQGQGYDTHGGVSDPMFTSLSGVPSIWDVTPATNSPLVNAGTNLSAVFTTDYYGSTRTTWDVGAVNVGTNGVGPIPPPVNPTNTVGMFGRVKNVRVKIR